MIFFCTTCQKYNCPLTEYNTGGIMASIQLGKGSHREGIRYGYDDEDVHVPHVHA